MIKKIKEFLSPTKTFIRLIKYYGSEQGRTWHPEMSICDVFKKTIHGFFNVIGITITLTFAFGLIVNWVATLGTIVFSSYQLVDELSLILFCVVSAASVCVLILIAYHEIKDSYEYFLYSKKSEESNNIIFKSYDAFKNKYCFKIDFSKFDKKD